MKRIDKNALRYGMTTVLALVIAALLPAQNMSIDEIIDRLDENLVQDTSYAEITMTVKDRFGERTSTMEAYSKGRDLSLIEFTSAAERGQKVLRTEDEIYLFYPDAAELVRLQGAALRESMLGSDISYEDMTGNKTLRETYDAELLGTERVNGRDCYKVRLEAKRANVAYPVQVMWVDTEDFSLQKSEQYSLNGRLLKTIEVNETELINGRYIATDMTISDALKRNSSTRMVMEDIELGLRLSDDLFSLEELTW